MRVEGRVGYGIERTCTIYPLYGEWSDYYYCELLISPYIQTNKKPDNLSHPITSLKKILTMSPLLHILSLPLLLFLTSPFALASPLLHTPRSNPTYYGLIFAQNSGCTPDQTTQVLAAIADMRALSTSAVTALTLPQNKLASYFFQSNYFAAASKIFNAALYLTQPLGNLPTDSSQGTQVQLVCANATDAICAAPSPGNNDQADKSSTTTTWGYIGSNPAFGGGADGTGAAQIFACPAMLDGTLPRNGDPCTGTPGQATLGWAFLRTFIQLKTLGVVPKYQTGKTISDRAPGVVQSHALVQSGSPDFSLNADNFAELGLWAWDVGVSDNLERPELCLDKFPYK